MDQGTSNVYRGCKPIVDAEYGDERDCSPAEVVVEALAEAAGVDPIDLPPLYDFVDTDALDRLFDAHHGGTRADALLSFRVETWNVFVRADGRVRVCDGTRSTDPVPVFDSIQA